MTNWQEDPWIRERSIIQPAKIHAIGYLALRWNACERWALELFYAVSGLTTETGRIIAHDFGDRTLWQKLRDLAEVSSLLPDAIEHIRHAEKLYDRCRENRNQFVHVALLAADPVGEGLRLARNKGPKNTSHPLDDSLSNLRRVCEDIENLKAYMTHITMVIRFSRGRLRPTPTSSWPDKPVLPKPVWTPLPQTPPRPKRPLESSPD